MEKKNTAVKQNTEPTCIIVLQKNEKKTNKRHVASGKRQDRKNKIHPWNKRRNQADGKGIKKTSRRFQKDVVLRTLLDILSLQGMLTFYASPSASFARWGASNERGGFGWWGRMGARGRQLLRGRGAKLDNSCTKHGDSAEKDANTSVSVSVSLPRTRQSGRRQSLRLFSLPRRRDLLSRQMLARSNDYFLGRDTHFRGWCQCIIFSAKTNMTRLP